MSKHKKKPTTLIRPGSGLKPRVDKAVAEGRFQQALELARQLNKHEPSPENLELLKTVSLGRVRQLHEQKYDRDALSMLDAARHIDPLNPAWLQSIAELYAVCGGVQQSLSMLGQLPEGTDSTKVLARAADAALVQRAAGRSLLPAALQQDFDRIAQAFRETETGRDEEAKNTLQGIGLRSPFLEWKVFLRGLQAYYQGGDGRAIENWQRLDPERVPARLAAPFRFQIDEAYRAAQPPAAQVMLRKKMDQVSSTGLAARLGQLRVLLGERQSLAQAFRHLDTLVPILRQEAPHVVPRLANVFYWAILRSGPDDIPRYNRVFGPPASDPHFYRLGALAFEQAGELAEAHIGWQNYQNDLMSLSPSWPADVVKLARALIWLHMGENAARIPSRKKRARMPAFLRNLNFDMTPLKPPAEKCFRESLKLAPDLLEAHVALFQHEVSEERFVKAIGAANKLLKQFPDHVPTLESLADLMVKRGKPGEALQLVQRAVRHNPLNRHLRDKVGTIHLHCARAALHQEHYEAAREHYRQALALAPEDRRAILCKWAAGEFKAGNPSRAEELIQEARSGLDSTLTVSYQMLIEVLRLELERALKERFETEFKAGLAQPPKAANVAELLEITRNHQTLQAGYTGQAGHVKQLLTYAEKARKRVAFTEKELTLICECLVDLGASNRSIQGYLTRGRREFPKNPVFLYLEAVDMLMKRKPYLSHYQVGSLLSRADRLARAMAEGPEKTSMLEKIGTLKQSTQLLDPFGDFGMPGFFGMPDEDDDDFDGPF